MLERLFPAYILILLFVLFSRLTFAADCRTELGGEEKKNVQTTQKLDIQDSKLPVIDFAELTDIDLFDLPNAKVFSAQYQGRKVFVKNTTAQEMAFTFILSNIGIGQKMLARSKTKNSHFMITEFIPGELFHLLWPKIDRPLADRKIIMAQIKDILHKLSQMGIVTDNFQFLIEPNNKIWVIDAETYEFATVAVATKKNDEVYQYLLTKILPETIH